MTKHRSREDRIQEILDATSDVIDEHGLPALTMDAIAAHCSLSKGGVYRFFPNKHAVCLALFDQIYSFIAEINVEECLSWNLPITETLSRLIFRDDFSHAQVTRHYRLWLLLLSQSLLNEDFRKTKQKYMLQIEVDAAHLISAVLARDGLELSDQTKNELTMAIQVANTMLEGMVIEALCGTPREDLQQRIRWWLERILRDAVQKFPSVNNDPSL